MVLTAQDANDAIVAYRHAFEAANGRPFPASIRYDRGQIKINDGVVEGSLSYEQLIAITMILQASMLAIAERPPGGRLN